MELTYNFYSKNDGPARYNWRPCGLPWEFLLAVDEGHAWESELDQAEQGSNPEHRRLRYIRLLGRSLTLPLNQEHRG